MAYTRATAHFLQEMVLVALVAYGRSADLGKPRQTTIRLRQLDVMPASQELEKSLNTAAVSEE